MIKKRNLDSSLIQWIMSVTGLGPGIGELFWVAPAISTTSRFAQELADSLGIDNTYATPTAAEAATLAYRNDVLLVMPGAYAQTAALTWDKAHTHIVGLGGPNVGGDYTESNVVMYTATSAIGYVLDISGQNCIFKNVVFENVGSSATNYAAINLNNYGCVFDTCTIAGQMGATAAATAACASLYIGGSGMYPVFRDCQIGQDVWSNRSGANGGVIRFTSTSARPNGGDFVNCRIISCSGTATVAMVAIPAAAASGRGWRYWNCVFANFDGPDANGTHLNQAFYTVTGTQQESQLLHNCSLFGIDEWQDGDFAIVKASMPSATTQGGIATEPTTYFGE